MSTSNPIIPKSIKTNYVLNLVYEVFALLAPLITTPYISRVLGAEGVGIYSYTNSIAQYFILLGNLGVLTYGQMAIAACRDNREETSRIFYELWILRALTTLISLSLYIAVSFISTQYREAMLVLSVLVFATVFDLTWLFRGIEDFSKVVLRNFIVKIATIALIFLLVKKADDVILYILLIALSTLLGNITFLFSMRGVLCRVRISSLRIFRHTKQCLIFFIPTIATSVYTILDKTMLGLLTDGATQNGYYEQAHKIEQVLIVAITSLNTIMRSRMSFLYNQNKLDEMRTRLSKSISFILLIAVPMTAGLIGIAPNFIPLFLGKGFTESILLLQIFSFLLIAIGLSNCLNTHFLGPAGRQGKNNYVLIMGAAINFIFNYITIPRYGAVGAAIGSVIAEALILAGYLYLIRDFMKATILIRLGWKYILSGAIMGLIVALVRNLNVAPFILITLQVFFGITIYIVIIVLLKDSFFIKCVGNVSSYVMRMKRK